MPADGREETFLGSLRIDVTLWGQLLTEWKSINGRKLKRGEEQIKALWPPARQALGTQLGRHSPGLKEAGN